MALNRLGRTGALALASLFLAASLAYGLGWTYHVGRTPIALLGVDTEYEPNANAFRLDRVLDGLPAHAAGLRPGDRITAINRRRLTTKAPFYDAIYRGRPGDTVRVTVERPGSPEPFETVATLTNAPVSVRPFTVRRVADELLRFYPIAFLAVMAVLLLQRPQDRNAWLVSLLFASFIAGAPLEPGMGHPWLRRFALSYKILFMSVSPAFFYWLFAVFPARSPIDRRLPALKLVFLAFGLTIGAPLAILMGMAGTWDPVERIVASPAWRPVGALVAVSGLSAFLLGVASLVSNYRAAPDPAAKRRTRVIVWGTVATVTPFVVLQVSSGQSEPYDVFPFWVWAPAVFALFFLPISFAYAVVRYRVIEIPLLLRRSARYLIVQRGLMLVVAALALAATVGLALFFPTIAPHRPELAVPAGLIVGVGFGLAMAWASTHVQRGVAQRIDRAFFRGAYDARRIMEDLAVQASRTTSRHELASLLGACLDEALRPSSLVVYLDRGDEWLEAVSGDVPPELSTLPVSHPSLRMLAETPEPFVVEPREDESHPVPLLAALVPECLVPMTGRTGTLAGLLVLGLRRSGEPYSSEDRRLLASVCRQAGLALENMSLAERMAQRLETERRAAQELAIAHEVQARLLPQQTPSVATLDIRGACQQARAVGGDYYDFLDMGDGFLALVLADISGKGISAALLMANLQAHLRAQYLAARQDPVGLLTTIDRLMFETTAPAHFATLFFGRYDDASRRMVYANCGHNPPLLIRACGAIEWLQPTAPAVGLLPVFSCTIGEVTLNAGDTLIVYTDGVTEAMDDDDECFGEERLLTLATRVVHLPLDALVTTIMDEVQRFSGTVQEDDLTLVVARAR